MQESVVVVGDVCAWTSERLWIVLLELSVFLECRSIESEGLVDGDGGCVEKENGEWEKKRNDKDSSREDLISEEMRWIGGGSERRKEIEITKVFIGLAECRIDGPSWVACNRSIVDPPINSSRSYDRNVGTRSDECSPQLGFSGE